MAERPDEQIPTSESGGGTPPPVPDRRRPGSSAVAAPAVSLPKPGGAIRGIGETLSVNPVTGTAAMSIPLATTPGRDGFGPELALNYDSGAGNGPFGFGWSLPAPAISRRTEQGLPRYDDAAESDVFLLPEAGELVPVPAGPGAAAPPAGFRVDRYRPRVEGPHARVERFTDLADGTTFWRVTSRENITAEYGTDDESRIRDPYQPTRVFSWLLRRRYDDRGNVADYRYVAEDGAGVDLTRAHERNRAAEARATNRYLKRIRYGNQVSRLVDPVPADPGWLFEVVLDYGDHHPQTPQPQPDRPWPVRDDPFSTYRSGFEIRGYRLCRRVLMFHHFPHEPQVGVGCLVRATELAYRTSEPVGAFLTTVTQHSYRRTGTGYRQRSIPPLELSYQEARFTDEVREIDPDSLAGAPAGLAGDGYQWVDLDGEGIAGLLAEAAAGWFYKPNLGRGRLGPAQAVPRVPAQVPAGAGLVPPAPPAGPAGAGAARRGPLPAQLVDLAGDGDLDLVTFAGPVPGFYERDPAGGWAPFTAFESLPRIDWADPGLRMVDLDGDGNADLLLTEDAALTWYPSRSRLGFDPGQRVSLPLDEDRGPRLVLAGAAEAVHLADLSGDGLPDLVRVRNGEICYWPNLGHGRFGAKVTMDDAPWLDRAETFRPEAVLLADVDGSGVADLIYPRPDGVRVYLNRSGNGWDDGHQLPASVPADGTTTLSAIDLFGVGTTCLVWSSPRAEDARRSLRYLDLMGGRKPHLLVGAVNNLGAETHLAYAASTEFQLADRAAGRPWHTRLPFPVQVVREVESLDRISRNRFVTRYAYHHGFYDGSEREFRGFGMVEQWDTEEVGAIGGAPGELAAAPSLTRSWYHTGAYLDEADGLSRRYAEEYWREPGLGDAEHAALLLPDTVWPEVIRHPDGSASPHRPSADELRDACRALHGSLLRREVYGLDGSPREPLPYRVEEQNFTVELLQPKGSARHPVCLVLPRESIVYHYERTEDPRVTHELVLDTDGFGNVLRGVTVAYPRRQPLTGDDLPTWAVTATRTEQGRSHALLTVNRYTNPVDSPDAFRLPLRCESSSYQLLQAVPAAPPGRTAPVRLPALRAAVDVASDGTHDLAPDDTAGTGVLDAQPYRRLLDRDRTVFRRDDLTGPLPLGTLESRALPHRELRLAFTTELLARWYRRDGTPLLPDPGAVLEDEGGYLAGDGGWWRPSTLVNYSVDPADDGAAELARARAHFFRPVRFTDQFGHATLVEYDPYDLLVASSLDPVGNLTRSENDYRVGQPWRVTDANGNRSAVAFDTLGMVTATAVMGKPTEPVGDELAGFAPDLDDAALAGYLADPTADPAPLLGRAGTRTIVDAFGYHRTREADQPQPAAVITLMRPTHAADLPPGDVGTVLHDLTYVDGFGRQIQKKNLVEPGPVTEPGPVVAARWVGSGWTVYNNKGKPVRQYEPFFSATHAFEFAADVGVSPVIGYDPLDRVVATLHPDGSYQKVVFDPWRQEQWDRNDTVLLDPRTDPDVRAVAGGFLAALPADWRTWHGSRAGGARGPDERVAAERTAEHAATPDLAYLDPLGRTFLTASHHRRVDPDGTVDELHPSRVVLDLGGEELAAVDALGRTLARCDYDLTGTRIVQSTMDAGRRWLLVDCLENPIRSWDDQGRTVTTRYDAARRPVSSSVQGPGLTGEVVLERTEYGEGVPGDTAANLRGEVHRQLDGAGVAVNERYDFKGNVLAASRRFPESHRTAPDWSGPVALSSEVHATTTVFDALNRPTTLTAPDGSVVTPGYNVANLFESMAVREPGATTPTTVVTGVDYNPKGQRLLVAYGNGVTTTLSYDPLTFRLVRSHTARPGTTLQDLRYTYDPVGNIVRITDAAQPSVFFRNRLVSADLDYRYDSRYRLVEATGREHLSQGAAVPPDAGDAIRSRLPHPHDGDAMARYRERYVYDPVGNLTRIVHRTEDPATPGWTRDYPYEAASLLDPAETGNRLTGTGFAYDPHGNPTAMPELALLRWDPHDRLAVTARQQVGTGDPESTYYAYDATGRRMRSVTERAGPSGEPSVKVERLYLGGLELLRERAPDGTVTTRRETVHVTADQGRVALVERTTVGGQPGTLVRFQVGDQLSSSRLELDPAGQVISHEDYYPYGGTAYQAVRSQVEAPKRYRFAGKCRDEETGLYYSQARYYAPWLARWVSPDPGGIRDGGNPYQYARSNPVVVTDESGLDGEPVVSSGDPNDPRNYTDFESFRSGVLGPWSEQGLREAWAAAHPEEAHPPFSGAPPPQTAPLASSAPPEPENETDTLAIGEYEEYTEEYEETVEEPVVVQESSWAMAGAFMGRAAVVGGGTAMVDSPAPGPADVAGGVIIVGGAIIALGIGIFASSRTTTTTTTRTTTRTRTRTRRRRAPLTYVTYTKYNPVTGETYVGRSMGYGTPAAIVAARDRAHHMTLLGFGPAVLDEFAVATRPFGSRHSDPSYRAIRGREQQMIDALGGSWSDVGRGNSLSGNAIRGVGALNPRGRIYHAAASALFGQIAPYTGF